MPKTCTVRFDNNKYSVMATAVGRPVEVHAYAERIVIRQDGLIVGEHARGFGRGQTIYDPWHYVPVLARKPGALRNGAPFKDWVLPPAMAATRRKLRGSDDGDQTARAQIVADVELSHPGKTRPGQCQLPHRLAIVGDQRATYAAIRDPAAFAQRPDRGGAAKVEAKALVGGKIVDCGRRALAGEIGGRCHDCALCRAKFKRCHARIGQRAYQKRHVRAVEIQVYNLIRQ